MSQRRRVLRRPSSGDDERDRRRAGAVPTLDLHGDRQEPAIRRVTDFLEENRTRSTVRIITGAGSHSHDGPVLRAAVQRLLEKRQMTFQQDSPGSFTVQCDTGITLYREVKPEDTKVVLVNELPPAAPNRASRSVSFSHLPPRHAPSTIPVSSIAIAQPVVDAQCVLSRSTSCSESTQPMRESVITSERYISLSGLTPAEVASEDAALYNARELSLETALNERRANESDTEAIQRAMEISRQEFESTQQEEAALMERALAMSSQEHNQVLQNEELLLQKALEESERDATEVEELSETEMDRALREALARSIEETARRDQEEERLLQEVMALSLE